MPAPDFERIFAPGTRHTLRGGDALTIRLRTGVELCMPSGRVVAGEPFMYDPDDDGFVQRVPPGRYPLVLVLGVYGEDPDGPDAYATVAAAKLVIRDEPVDSWELAVRAGQDPATLGDDEFFGYPVDGGTGGFVDAQNIASLCDDSDDYLERLMMALDVRQEDYTAAGVLTNDESEPVLAVFSSGGGDGVYPTWVGRNAAGDVVCVLTDFFVLPDEDADEPAPPEPAAFALSDFAQGHEMRVGQTLRRQSLTSPSGRYTLVHQDDGNLVLYSNTQLNACWASGTDGSGAQICALREDAGLVILHSDGRQAWSSGTTGPVARLMVRDDGDVVLEDSAGAVVWSSGTAVVVPEGPVAIGDRMEPGQTLGRQSLTSASGRYTLVHQDDGDLVLYDNTGRGRVWASGTQWSGTARCLLHRDGNLAIYDKRARVVWSTETAGHPGSVLTVRDDGLALTTPDGDVVWSVQTTPGRSAASSPVTHTDAFLTPAIPAKSAESLSEGLPAAPLTQRTTMAQPATMAKPLGTTSET
jgi:hypothetical protein